MTPRKPTQNEIEELKQHLIRQEEMDEENTDLVDQAAIAVFDSYTTDCPGYSGKVMVVVWSGCPKAIQSFIWDKGKIRHAGRSNW